MTAYTLAFVLSFLMVSPLWLNHCRAFARSVHNCTD